MIGRARLTSARCEISGSDARAAERVVTREMQLLESRVVPPWSDLTGMVDRGTMPHSTADVCSAR
jgi:hypothetical protein